MPLFIFQILLGLFFIFLFSDDSKKFIYCFKLPDHPGETSFWLSLFTFSFNWSWAIFLMSGKASDAIGRFFGPSRLKNSSIFFIRLF